MCPFIDAESRTRVTDTAQERHNAKTPGEKCFVCYRDMLRMWKQSPRWTTAHQIYLTVLHKHNFDASWKAANELAWQVFFQLHVMPYEVKKRKENGEVEI